MKYADRLAAVVLAIAVPSTALAVAPTFTPSDGTAALGPAVPAWAWRAGTATPPGDLAPLQAELDAAWRDRAALDPEAASRRLAEILPFLVPTLTVEQRDLLQRASFLAGLLQIDAAGALAKVPGAVTVAGVRIPAPWLRGIAVSPGSPAPAASDAAFATQAYDAARTAIVAAGGPSFDPGSADLDVRLDGQPIRAATALLSGLHTVSLHRPGAEPLALLVRSGAGSEGIDVVVLQHELDAVVAFIRDGTPVSAQARGAIHAAVTTPAVEARDPSGGRQLWLVDGPARWGKPRFSAGVEIGATALFGAWADTPAGCGGLDHGDKLLTPLGASALASVGPWQIRGGGGVILDVGDDAGFAVEPSVQCGSISRPGASATIAWGWLSVGGRARLGTHGEIEPAFRVGATGPLAWTEAVVRVPLNLRAAVRLELAPHAGIAWNLWSDEANRSAFVAGLDTTLLFGGR